MFKVFYFTNKGKRDINEDSLFVFEKVISNTNMEKCESIEIDSTSIFLSVADGIGGNARGEIASKMVLEVLQACSKNLIKKELSVEDAIKRARDELENYIKVYPKSTGMGCAIAGILVVDNEVEIFNIGDCRVYRVLGQKVIKLTRDHTVAEKLFLDGYITLEEASSHPKKHFLTSAVIADNYCTDIKIYKNKTEILDKDMFIICSDGFWSQFENEISAIFSSEDFCKEFKERLPFKELDDNISFILLKKEK